MRSLRSWDTSKPNISNNVSKKEEIDAPMFEVFIQFQCEWWSIMVSWRCPLFIWRVWGASWFSSTQVISAVSPWKWHAFSVYAHENLYVQLSLWFWTWRRGINQRVLLINSASSGKYSRKRVTALTEYPHTLSYEKTWSHSLMNCWMRSDNSSPSHIIFRRAWTTARSTIKNLSQCSTHARQERNLSDITYFSPSWRSTVDLMKMWLHWMLTMPVISMFLNFLRFCLFATFKWSQGTFYQNNRCQQLKMSHELKNPQYTSEAAFGILLKNSRYAVSSGKYAVPL